MRRRTGIWWYVPLYTDLQLPFSTYGLYQISRLLRPLAASSGVPMTPFYISAAQSEGRASQPVCNYTSQPLTPFPQATPYFLIRAITLASRQPYVYV